LVTSRRTEGSGRIDRSPWQATLPRRRLAGQSFLTEEAMETQAGLIEKKMLGISPEQAE
jgi:hypothetical protein